jgi:hypothetical protein
VRVVTTVLQWLLTPRWLSVLLGRVSWQGCLEVGPRALAKLRF